MASLMYNKGLEWLGSGDLTTATIKVMLVTSSYTANKDHDFASSPAANEISGTGYTSGFAGSGRKTLASKTFAESDANDNAAFDAADLLWTGLQADCGTAAACVIYVHDTSDAASTLLCYLDGGGFPRTFDGTDFPLVWNSSGIFTIAQA